MSTICRFRTWPCLFVVLLAIVCVGCASIMGGGSRQIIPITSVPEATYVVKQGATGMTVAEGTTPGEMDLSRKNEYIVEVSLPGYRDQTVAITKGTNPWVWGNLACGGVLGIIIDYSSGAAYKLEPEQISIEMLTVSLDGKESTYVLFCRLASSDT